MFIDTLYGRPNTIKTYRSLFSRWIEPFLDKNIDELVLFWTGEKLSPRTIRSLVNLYNQYSLWKNGKQVNTKNILRKIERTEQKKEPRALTKAEARLLLQTCDQSEETKHLSLACHIAYYTGARKGEVFGLEWEDVDFYKGEIFIQRSYNGPTKNGKSRIVGIPDELQKKLLDNQFMSDQYKRIIPHVFDPNPSLKYMCKIAKIKPITFHAFRHTFATLALEAQRSPKDVQLALGHSSLSTTLDVYWNTQNKKLKLGFC